MGVVSGSDVGVAVGVEFWVGAGCVGVLVALAGVLVI
jgi:hypothetical protein